MLPCASAERKMESLESELESDNFRAPEWAEGAWKWDLIGSDVWEEA
jgi:hypothetical protein